MVTIAIRTVLIYFFVLVVVRLMGKREIGQLSPFDFVVAIMMAELAVLPMESPDIPLWYGIVPLSLLVLLEILLSYLALHSHFVRSLLGGRPQVVIQNGQVLKEEMCKSRYNLEDLLSQLRERGYPNIEDIEFGVLETSGKISIIPKSQKRPLTPADMGIETDYEGLPAVLIMDGKIMYNSLDLCGLSREWLQEKLKEKDLRVAEVFLATLNTKGEFIAVPKNGNEKFSGRKFAP